MSRVLTDNQLREAIEKGDLIVGGDPNCVEGLKSEVQNRKEAHKEFKADLKEVQRETLSSAARTAILWAIIAAVLAGLVLLTIAKVFLD